MSKGNVNFRCGYARSASGGAGGDTVYADTVASLRYWCDQKSPLTIRLKAMTTFNLNGKKLFVKSNKTLIGGVGTSLSKGELRVQDATNVVIYHIRFRDPVGDGITVRNSDLVHINQCTFDQGTAGTTKHGGTADGAVDVVGWTRPGYSRVTIANSKFIRYHKIHLFGWDTPGDQRIRVTCYRNWYKGNRRIPQCNRAWVHMRNCVHDWNDRCCASYAKARVYVDRCYINSKERREYCGEYKARAHSYGYLGFGGGSMYKYCSPREYKVNRAKKAKAHAGTMPLYSKSWRSATKIRKRAGMQTR